MTPRLASPSRLLPLSVLGLAIALAALHLRYPLPYVYRVMAFRDAGFEDIHRFPARVIAAPEVASELASRPDPAVARILAEHPEVESLDALLDATDTTAFLVVHRGALVEERYLAGHDRATPQNTFSVAKSVTSLLVGLAERDGVLELSAPITRYLPELARRDPGFAAITVEHLLDMRSGIRYRSGVDFPFIDADNALIYYSLDLEALLLRRTRIAASPGVFQYNNYNPPLLGLILSRAIGRPVSEVLESEIWRPLGAEAPAGWTTDNRGMERMESGFFARGRDLARLGRMVLESGRVEGLEVVPADWIARSTALAEPVELERYDGRTWGYRLGWWIVPRPEGRSDFCGIGRFGQFVYLSPQHEVVFVRTGPDRGDWGDRDWTELFYRTAARLGGAGAGGLQEEPSMNASTASAGI